MSCAKLNQNFSDEAHKDHYCSNCANYAVSIKKKNKSCYLCLGEYTRTGKGECKWKERK